eukprot:TRINITY_DN4568_c0_g2_i1.p1 TRINITY_DN4568_c0_g2~~TRINITY_DN4568_c0_g2_i1.p1  ORF type:complete len:369 (-),score=77.00 TRINITY_DN4568_c0_g2_i1:336-1442(-)
MKRRRKKVVSPRAKNTPYKDAKGKSKKKNVAHKKRLRFLTKVGKKNSSAPILPVKHGAFVPKINWEASFPEVDFVERERPFCKEGMDCKQDNPCHFFEYQHTQRSVNDQAGTGTEKEIKKVSILGSVQKELQSLMKLSKPAGDLKRITAVTAFIQSTQTILQDTTDLSRRDRTDMSDVLFRGYEIILQDLALYFDWILDGVKKIDECKCGHSNGLSSVRRIATSLKKTLEDQKKKDQLAKARETLMKGIPSKRKEEKFGSKQDETGDKRVTLTEKKMEKLTMDLWRTMGLSDGSDSESPEETEGNEGNFEDEAQNEVNGNISELHRKKLENEAIAKQLADLKKRASVLEEKKKQLLEKQGVKENIQKK